MADLVWTFDDGTSEGWRFSNDGLVPTGDAPITDGAIQSYDDHTNNPQYYTPADLTGDQSKLYGAVFSYNWSDNDVQGPNDQFQGRAALILSAQDGTRIRVTQSGPTTIARFVTGEFSATLQIPPVESNVTFDILPVGGSTRPATDAELRDVLSQLDFFVIQTDLRSGGDRFRLLDASISPACFTAGTLIETASGTTPVELLQVGDLVRTRDNGLQPIRWIGTQKFTGDQLENTPNFRPVRIRAGAIGTNSPASDLLVSPQHRVLIRSAIAQRMFGTSEILAPAKSLCEVEGIDVVEDDAGVEYFHLMFDQHEIIFSNGAETESFYTGEQALKSAGASAREEIFALFPELKDQQEPPAPARPIVQGKLARKLADRHAKNGRDLNI